MRVVGQHKGGYQFVHADGQDDAVSGGVDVNVAFLDQPVVVGKRRGLDADVDAGARLVLQVLGDFVGEARCLFVLCEDWNAQGCSEAVYALKKIVLIICEHENISKNSIQKVNKVNKLES